MKLLDDDSGAGIIFEFFMVWGPSVTTLGKRALGGFIGWLASVVT